MEDVTRCVEELQRAIRKSSVYREYQEARLQLDGAPELKQKTDEFRGRNYQIQNSGNLDHFAEMERLEREYGEIRKHPLVSRYLETELDFCRMVQKIQELLVEAMDLEIDGFEECIF